MSETFTVYALFDTRAPDVVRYIGFSKDPAARLRAHVWEARRSRKRSHRLHWLRELDRDALKPQWRTLSVFETRLTRPHKPRSRSFVSTVRWDVRLSTERKAEKALKDVAGRFLIDNRGLMNGVRHTLQHFNDQK